MPKNRGCFGVCCNGVIGRHPPAYTYFPCNPSACGTSASCAAPTATAATTLLFAKQAGASTLNGVPEVTTAGGGEAQSSGTRPAPDRRLSTYKPAAVAKEMPVLAPTPFEEATAEGCLRSWWSLIKLK